ncbi:GNAT family N-acetyltransferase [Clostridium sp.]|uniref:GNAT family N-acetyltransferase n=1 Tax=Clostridium sp. TaxID=1506 RepID=UPI0034645673
MKNIEKWEKGKEQYLLNNGFILIRANESEYGIHYAIYVGVDEEFTYSWDKLSHDTDGDDCHRFWIFKDNKRVGGVVIEPNYLAQIFVESPYAVDKFSIIRELDLERYIATNSLQASTLVYDRNTNELIGVCLAGKNVEDINEFSMINQIGVKPAYRWHGIAENMIKKALTVLKDISPATKLDVTVGNAAEALYYKMGFFPGIQSVALYKKLK